MAITDAKTFDELVRGSLAANTLPALYNVAEELSGFAGETPQGARQRLAIVGDLTVDFLASGARVALARHNVFADVYLAPFGAFTPELLSPTSGLYAFKPEVVLLAPDFREYVEPAGPDADPEALKAQLDKRADGMARHWRRLQDATNCRIVHQLFYAPPQRLAGVAERRLFASRDNQVRYLNERLLELGAGSVAFLEFDRFAAQVGSGPLGAERAYFNGRQPFDTRWLPAWIDYFAAAWREATGRAKKVLVLDLDNTVWGGVIGDDGVEGIALGEGSPRGEAFAAWQGYIKSLAARGVALAVSSKNDEKLAKTGFDHPHSLLKYEDFAAFVASWDDKAAGLRKIAQQLNLGLDSFVFADDNPVECGLVQQELPMVGVVMLGADPAQFIAKFEAGCWFSSSGYTADDIKRSQQYAARRQALAEADEATDLPTYLRGLGMIAEIDVFREEDIERLAQLEGKTNQFNTMTRRYNADQLREFMKRDDAVLRVFRLKDKFGDHGLVSTLIGFVENGRLTIDSWLMSCRVFSRTAEQAIANHLVEVARSRNVREVVGLYKPTAKNGVVEKLYEGLGFASSGGGEWRLEVGRAEPLHAYMKVQVSKAAAPAR